MIDLNLLNTFIEITTRLDLIERRVGLGKYAPVQKAHGERVEARQRQTYLNGEAGLREWQRKTPGKTCS